MKQTIPEYVFDEYGCRFPVSYLSKMKYRIAKLTISDMAEFVDEVTYDMVKRGKAVCKKSDFKNIDHKNINVTAFGNTAFIIKYHPDNEQRELATLMLIKLKQYHYEKNN